MALKLCTIVGMGPGVSYSVAQKFGKLGFQIAMVARKEQTLTDFGEKLAKDGISAHGFSADAGDSVSLVAAFEKIKSSLGDTNVLIYNAAVGSQVDLLKVSAETLCSDYKVNVVGAVVSVQCVVDGMRNSGNGTIILTGGGFAIYPMPIFGSLAMGKAAIRNLTGSLFQLLKADNIHVGSLLIAGVVEKGTKHDPDLIAEKFVELYEQEGDAREQEIIY